MIACGLLLLRGLVRCPDVGPDVDLRVIESALAVFNSGDYAYEARLRYINTCRQLTCVM